MKRFLMINACVLMMAYYLFLVYTTYPIDICIPEINLVISGYKVRMYFMLFSAIWFVSSPMRKWKSKSGIIEAVYLLFPTAIHLLIVLAESSPILALISVCLWSTLCIASYSFLHVCRKPFKVKTKRYVVYTRIIKMTTALLTVVFLLAPATITLFKCGIKTPEYEITNSTTVTEQEFPVISDEVNKIQDRELLTSIYSKLETQSISLRLEALHELVAYEATQVLRFPVVNVVAASIPTSYTMGYFDGKKIVISLTLLNGPTDELIDTVLHELHHASTRWLIENIDWEDPVTNNMYFDTVRCLQANELAYISYSYNPDIGKAENEERFENYQNQPLEKYAREFASQELNRIIEVVTNEK